MNWKDDHLETSIFEQLNKYLLHRFLLFVFLFCCCASAHGQRPLPFIFTHYSTKDGLGSNELYKVQQDRTGFLWIATNNGLQRFDGTRFRTFMHEEGDSTSLPSNVVQRLFIDKDDVLWGATSKAEFFVFDESRFTCRRIPVRMAQMTNLLLNETMFIPDLEGHLFLLVMGHQLLAYDVTKGEFSQAANFIPISIALEDC